MALPTMFVLVMTLLPLAATASSPPPPPVRFTLAAPANATAGGPVPLRFVLENCTDHELWALTWYTPLEGILGAIFSVTRDGAPVTYSGPMVKRGDPVADDYVRLAPGETASATVDLSSAYDLSGPGCYAVEFVGRIHDVAAATTEIPRPGGEQNPVDVPGNSVKIRLAAP